MTKIICTGEKKVDFARVVVDVPIKTKTKFRIVLAKNRTTAKSVLLKAIETYIKNC